MKDHSSSRTIADIYNLCLWPAGDQMIFSLAELQKTNPLLHSILKLKWRNSILETGMEIPGRSQRTQGAPPQHQYCRGGHVDDPLFVKYIYVVRAGIQLGVDGLLQTWGLITAHYRLITNFPVPTHCLFFIREKDRSTEKEREGRSPKHWCFQ